VAFDVYVGPLTLYYAGQWENVAQRYAREHGGTYHMIRTEGSDDRVTDLEVLRPALVEWRSQLSEALGSNISEPLDWVETSNEYATARPNWDGFASLRLWAAYAEHPDLELPLRCGELEEDPAYLRSMAKEAETRYPLIIRSLEFWLPSPFEFTFKAGGPNGDAVEFGSAPYLLKNLQDLNDATWKADQETIATWGMVAPSPEAPFEQAAKYGFSTMLTLAQYACEKRMPIKLDY
jgi:hypothetical protein